MNENNEGEDCSRGCQGEFSRLKVIMECRGNGTEFCRVLFEEVRKLEVYSSLMLVVFEFEKIVKFEFPFDFKKISKVNLINYNLDF